MKLDVREINEKLVGKEIIVEGWVRNHRKQKEFGFIDFSDGTCFNHLQIVYDDKLSTFEEIAVEVLNNVMIKLKNDYIDIYHYDSKIFNYSREKIKNIVLNLYKIMVERGFIASVKREGEPFTEGEIFTFTLPEKQKLIKLKMNKIKMNEKNLKWTISYMPLNVDFKDFLVDWYIVKIKPEETLLAINNIYSEQIEPVLKKNLTKRKKEIFEIIEEELRKKYPE